MSASGRGIWEFESICDLSMNGQGHLFKQSVLPSIVAPVSPGMTSKKSNLIGE
jgi:hypothetical protein